MRLVVSNPRDTQRWHNGWTTLLTVCGLSPCSCVGVVRGKTLLFLGGLSHVKRIGADCHPVKLTTALTCASRYRTVTSNRPSEPSFPIVVPRAWTVHVV